VLESAQRALRAGHDDDAQLALDEHARRFPGGELTLEAEVLSIELSSSRGEREQARARAQRLLARPEAARYQARLAALASSDTTHPSASGANRQPSHMKERR
jgi:hypothetical protein